MNGNDTRRVAAINAQILQLLIARDKALESRIVLGGSSGSALFVVSSTLSDSDLGFHDAGNGNSQQSGGVLWVATNAVLR